MKVFQGFGRVLQGFLRVFKGFKKSDALFGGELTTRERACGRASLVGYNGMDFPVDREPIRELSFRGFIYNFERWGVFFSRRVF